MNPFILNILKSANQSVGPEPFVATGGDVTDDGVYKYHLFEDAGTVNFTVLSGTRSDIEYLIVAPGGQASRGFAGIGSGGAGAGGRRGTPFGDPLATVSPGNYPVTVGAGTPKGTVSAEGTLGQKGGDSSVFGLTAEGGGGSRSYTASGGASADGGSGAGGVWDNITPGSGIPGQGHDGGVGYVGGYDYGAGAGGSPESDGANGTNTGYAAGGPGFTTDFTGTTRTFCKGGNGGKSLTAAVDVDGADGVNPGDGGSGGQRSGQGGGSPDGMICIRYLINP